MRQNFYEAKVSVIPIRPLRTKNLSFSLISFSLVIF